MRLTSSLAKETPNRAGEHAFRHFVARNLGPGSADTIELTQCREQVIKRSCTSQIDTEVRENLTRSCVPCYQP